MSDAGLGFFANEARILNYENVLERETWNNFVDSDDYLSEDEIFNFKITKSFYQL